MSSVQFKFRGLMAPVFTPFTGLQGINLNVIPAYAAYLARNGIKGVLVNGTTGEGVSLTQTERLNVFHEWLYASRNHGLTVMVQIGGTSIADVKFLARDAEDQGAHAILCLPDLFFRPNNVGDLIHYLKIVSRAAPKTPLLYYHIPSFTGIKLNMVELLERSSEVPTLVGIKFTDNDLEMGSSCVKSSLKDRAVFLGCDNLFLPALFKGFDSAIGTTINLFPSLNRKILECFQEKKFEEAVKFQEMLNENIEQITKHGSWVSSMKAAMRQITALDVGLVREPLKNVDLQDVSLHFHF